MSCATSKVAIAVPFQVFDFQAVMIMRHLVAPIIPENFHGHAFGRIAGHIAQPQSPSKLFEQLSHQTRSLRRMDAGMIYYDNHTPFAPRRTGQALLRQATKCFCISFLAPICAVGTSGNQKQVTRLGKTKCRGAGVSVSCIPICARSSVANTFPVAESHLSRLSASASRRGVVPRRKYSHPG